MKKYLKYVLLGVISAFALLFMVLFGINMYMSNSQIELSSYPSYEKKLNEIETRLNEIATPDMCVDALVKYKDYSKENYYTENMKSSEWVYKYAFTTVEPSDYISDITENCPLNINEIEEIANLYSLVVNSYDRITIDALYNYELSFSDVFFRQLHSKDISSLNYRVAKLQELFIIEKVLTKIEGEYND